MANTDFGVIRDCRYELVGFLNKCRTALIKSDAWDHLEAKPIDMIPSDIINGFDTDDFQVFEHVRERESRIDSAKKLEALHA